MKTTMNLPASCTALTDEEMTYTDGGSVTLLGFEFANTTAAVLTVGAVAVAAIAGVCIIKNVWDMINSSNPSSVIGSSLENGQSFIDQSLSAGQSFLASLTSSI